MQPRFTPEQVKTLERFKKSYDANEAKLFEKMRKLLDEIEQCIQILTAKMPKTHSSYSHLTWGIPILTELLRPLAYVLEHSAEYFLTKAPAGGASVLIVGAITFAGLSHDYLQTLENEVAKLDGSNEYKQFIDQLKKDKKPAQPSSEMKMDTTPDEEPKLTDEEKIINQTAIKLFGEPIAKQYQLAFFKTAKAALTDLQTDLSRRVLFGQKAGL